MISPITNTFGQTIGAALPDWNPPPHPSHAPREGRWCRLEPLDPGRHAEALYQANANDDGSSWTYLPYGPFRSVEEYRSWMDVYCRDNDPLFFAISRKNDRQPLGMAAYLRILAGSGSIELGHLHFTEGLKRSAVSTEALFLMIKQAFDLGYRRCEWKCDSLNTPSRAAAERLGFSYEGTFRNATVYKGRTRDTAWFSIIDTEWPALKAAFEEWLAPENLDAEGKQRTSLSDLTGKVKVGR